MAGPANQILWRLNPLATIRRSISGAHGRRLVATAAGAKAEPETPVPVKTEAEQDSSDQNEKDDKIYLRRPSSDESSSVTRDQTSVTMPMSFMTGSIIGKRFYKEVTTRMADDGNGWTVILDYRTLKTPSKRPLKMPSLALAKAIAAEWEYQEADGIRPFTMPLMKLACTAMERVPLTRLKIIEHLVKKFHQDLVFCRSPSDSDLTRGVLGKAFLENFRTNTKDGENIIFCKDFLVDDRVLMYSCPDLYDSSRGKEARGVKTGDKKAPSLKRRMGPITFLPQVSSAPCRTIMQDVQANSPLAPRPGPKRQIEKFDPLLDWVETEFGFKPVVYSSFFGGKQEDGLVKAVESALKKTNDCELAAIDAMAAAAHSLIIPLGLVRGQLEIEEAIKLIRLEEDLQVDRWGLVEGGHDLDIADLRVQISSAAVFLGLSQRH